MPSGKVYLVGAGPGDPGLITVRGLELLARAEVVVADRLVNPALLGACAPTAEIVTRAASRDQDEINSLLVERARDGKRVVRLKGGDPFVFGRGGEEAEALAAAGVPFEVVPGVTAAIAAPAYAGIPVTHRGLSGVVAFATGHEADEGASDIDWQAVARGAGTLVLYMSVSRLDAVVARLLAAGRAPDEPVAIIERGTMPEQRTITGTLGDIVEKARAAHVQPPALTIVGRVVAERARIAWFENRRAPRILLLSTKDEPAELAGVEIVRVSPLVVVPRFAELKSAIGRLDELRAIAFASAHAVEHFVGALMSTGRDLRALAALKLAAVGAATARKLEEMHLRADLVGSEGGAALGREIHAAGWEGPVLLPRASDGRDELADALRDAGLRVEPVAAYDTIPDGAAVANAARQHRERSFDAIAFTSPKGARAFLDTLGRAPACTVGAIGETTRAALEAAGVRVDVTPPEPHTDALLHALAERLKIG